MVHKTEYVLDPTWNIVSLSGSRGKQLERLFSSYVVYRTVNKQQNHCHHLITLILKNLCNLLSSISSKYTEWKALECTLDKVFCHHIPITRLARTHVEWLVGFKTSNFVPSINDTFKANLYMVTQTFVLEAKELSTSDLVCMNIQCTLTLAESAIDR